MIEAAIHAVAFAMFNHYHRVKNPRATDAQIFTLWSTTHQKVQWYDRAESAINAYNKWKENNL